MLADLAYLASLAVLAAPPATWLSFTFYYITHSRRTQ